MLASSAWTTSARAAVSAANIFGNGMVVQQGMAVPIWGWAKAGEKVTVAFAGQQKTATADAGGKWMARLDAMPADKTPREMTIAGENTLTIKDVLVGEVWLCSGQHNMEMTVAECFDAKSEQAAATNATIRQFKVAHRFAHVWDTHPADDVSGQWAVCSPTDVAQFTATGYFFARGVAKELDTPVGIICDSWGNCIETWIAPEGFRAVPELKDVSRFVDSWIPTTDIGRQNYIEFTAKVREWLPKAEAAIAANQELPPAPGIAGVVSPDTDWDLEAYDQPTYLYNAMIRPIVPFAIRGALWYQGESNGREGTTYFHKMRALIVGWRQLWGEGDFPFYYVQLPNYVVNDPDMHYMQLPFYKKPDPQDPAGGSGWAKLREAQMMALAIPNTGMACTIDIGEPRSFFPRDKQDVGKRLALLALARTYGRKIVCSGPVYRSHIIEGDRVRISFDNVGGGLMVGEKDRLEPVKEVKGGKLKYFAVAGEDRVWHWANATIAGDGVVVSCDKVAEPAAVRYAFTMNPEGANLYNREGLPAVPFRTDDW